MKPWLKAMLCISISFMCMFTCIGYAAVSQSAVIFGNIEAEPLEPTGIYISKVALYSQNGVSITDSEIVLPTNLRSAFQVNSKNTSITYEITVYNKTDVTYWYLGAEALSGVGANNLIGEANGITITTKDHSQSNSSDFDRSDWIPPQTERVFYATYTFGSNAVGNISTMVNFSFGMNMGSFSDGFLKVLNDKDLNSAYGYNYLVTAFNNKYDKTNSTVIANIGDEKEIFNNLFGNDLTINIDGVDKPVTIIVERKNVDKKTNSGDNYTANGAPVGCEYTVYLTVDDLSAPNGKATVYAVTYTCGADGQWYQIGELYEGKCTITDYDKTDSSYQGAFDPDSWLAVKKDYYVTDDIFYKVGYEQGTEYDKLKTIEELMSISDQEFYNKVNNNSQKLLKPVCLILYTYTHVNGRYDENINYSNKNKSGYDALKLAFDKIKPYCYIGNGAQEVKIQNANSLSRAALIQLLENIQTTYDYYLTVNP